MTGPRRAANKKRNRGLFDARRNLGSSRRACSSAPARLAPACLRIPQSRGAQRRAQKRLGLRCAAALPDRLRYCVAPCGRSGATRCSCCWSSASSTFTRRSSSSSAASSLRSCASSACGAHCNQSPEEKARGALSGATPEGPRRRAAAPAVHAPPADEPASARLAQPAPVRRRLLLQRAARREQQSGALLTSAGAHLEPARSSQRRHLAHVPATVTLRRLAGLNHASVRRRCCALGGAPWMPRSSSRRQARRIVPYARTLPRVRCARASCHVTARRPQRGAPQCVHGGARLALLARCACSPDGARRLRFWRVCAWACFQLGAPRVNVSAALSQRPCSSRAAAVAARCARLCTRPPGCFASLRHHGASPGR